VLESRSSKCKPELNSSMKKKIIINKNKRNGIHSRHKLETTQMLVNGRMDKLLIYSIK
jgi:hypothetical protein